MDLNHIGTAAATFEQTKNSKELTKTIKFYLTLLLTLTVISQIKNYEMLFF